MLEVIIGVVIGFIIGIFVYRNNQVKLGKLADKVDDIYDKIEKKE